MASNNYYPLSRLDIKGSVDSGFQEPIDPLGPADPGMEINNVYHRNDIQQSPLASPVLDRRNMMYSDVVLQEQFMNQIQSLRHQQQLQQQLLLQQYQQRQKELAQEHEKQLHEQYKIQQEQLVKEQEKQMQDHYKQLVMLQKEQEFIAEQQKMENRQRMEKEMIDKNRLTQIKNKNKDEESAVASTEVKQRLQDFVLSKKQKEAVTRRSPPQFRHWPLDQSSPPTTGLSPPYTHTLLGKYDDDFPLRKTASEPNLKVRSALKQKVMERRITQSPILRRREKGLFMKRKNPLSIDCGSNSDSGPNSPPSGVHPSVPNGSCSNLKDEPHLHFMYNTMGYPNADLYTSPSMPNISLGRPPNAGTSVSHSNYTEAELRAARMGIPLPPGHMLGGFHPSLQGAMMDPSTEASLRSNYLAAQAQYQAMEEARLSGTKPSPLVGPVYPVPGASTSSETHHRNNRLRPLGRTQSAPLPFLPQNMLLHHQRTRIEQTPEHVLKDKQYLKQQIRQSVLQRANSKTHMENVDEETEAKLAQELKESQELDENEVVVVKASKMEDGIDRSKTLIRQESENLLMVAKPRHKAHHKPLARTHSSPLVTFPLPTPAQDVGPVKYKFNTGLAYDSSMEKHQCTCGYSEMHPEHAGRIQSIWSRLQERNLISKSERLKCRKASLEEIQSCHSEAYTWLYATNHLNRQKLEQKLFENFPMRFCALKCGGVGVDSDTVWNEFYTSTAARMAAGSVIELSVRVGSGELKNGFALVRPPGHHAEQEQAMGFCYFNSIAIAAKQLKEKLKMKKILIVDWDVHHGNGTQQMLYNDKEILYISIHRHDDGNFFPGTGSPEECGSKGAEGFNVNIAFSGGLNPPKGDAEYLAAFRTLVMPIAREFCPEIVLVSAGFDAADGHPAPLGGYTVSPACFGHLTRELMSLADGKLVLVLEGGYILPAICDAAEMCVKALLGEDIPALRDEEMQREPCKDAVTCFENTINIQSKHWPCVERYKDTIQLPLVEARKRETEETDTVTAFASLSMVTAKSLIQERKRETEETDTVPAFASLSMVTAKSNSVEQESEPMDETS